MTAGNLSSISNRRSSDIIWSPGGILEPILLQIILRVLNRGDENAMTKLHLVFGGELVDPQGTVFRNPDKLEIVGIFPGYAKAHEAWQAAAQRTVDNAHTRYFIAYLHRLRDEEQESSAEAAALES